MYLARMSLLTVRPPYDSFAVRSVLMWYVAVEVSDGFFLIYFVSSYYFSI